MGRATEVLEKVKGGSFEWKTMICFKELVVTVPDK
jgi:hypothetical protein